MNGAASKASRREIRRAFGDEAIAAINSHADSIADILKGMERFGEHLDDIEKRTECYDSVAGMDMNPHILLGMIREQGETAAKRITTAIHYFHKFDRMDLQLTDHHDILKRGFNGRLRWLLFGK